MGKNYHDMTPEEKREQNSRDQRTLVWLKWGIGGALFVGWVAWGHDSFGRYFLATIFSFWILWVLLDS